MSTSPMDFEEYLWATGIDKNLIAQIRANIQNREHIDDYFHQMFTKYFRMYMVVGGMPAAVKTYIETKDYVVTYDTLEEIMTLQDTEGRYGQILSQSWTR